MIKIENDEIEIRGQGLDIIQEFCGIIQAVRTEQPEMLAGVMMAWTDILRKDLDNIDTSLADKIAKVALDWLELNEVK